MKLEVIGALAIALVMVIILLVVGVELSSNLEGTMLEMKTDAANQNFTLAQSTTALRENELVGGSFVMRNGTRAFIINAANYTLDEGTGTVRFGVSEFNNTAVSVDYSYYFEGYAANAALDGLDALSDVGGWLPLVAIVSIAVIILALLFGMGLGRGKDR